MENLDIARTLTLLGDLLEIQGANPFRIRAYRNAVNTVNGLSRPLAVMVQEGEDLTALPGIGKNVAAHIVELLETGSIDRLREVEAEIPRSLAELMALDGVGPKKAKKLHDELGVKTVDDLEKALEAGRVQELEGFGARSGEKIQIAIAQHRKHTGRFRIDEAEQLVAGLLDHVRAAPGAERVDIAGSLRRRKETIGDVDILVECAGDGSPVVEHFVAFEGAERAEAAGPTKGSIVLQSGLQVDLRVVPPDSFGAALVYFTGSRTTTWPSAPTPSGNVSGSTSGGLPRSQGCRPREARQGRRQAPRREHRGGRLRSTGDGLGPSGAAVRIAARSRRRARG